MSQIGEPVAIAIIPAGSKKKCIFCEKDHQDEKPAPKHTFPRDMAKLKREGRSETIALGRSGRYPAEAKPPLKEWERDIETTGGYKAAAHHCIALKTASDHKISGELKTAKYDPNDGSNCSWLPYSQLQFVRARAYNKPLQKHRGGHTEAYFNNVKIHIDHVAKQIAKKFCTEDQKISHEKLRQYMKQQEDAIWMGIASANSPKYHLYNSSYLNPNAKWGSYPEEVGKTREEFLGQTLSSAQEAEDAAEGAESDDDPE
jgi:hypothetical protein